MKTSKYLLLITFLCFLTFSCSGDDDNGEPLEINKPPNSFALSSPTTGSTHVDRIITLSWTTSQDPDGDTVSYSILMGNSEANLTPIVNNITQTNYNLTTPLSLFTKYYWKVIAVDAKGGSTESDTGNFTVRGISALKQATSNAGFTNRYSHTSVVFDNKMWVIGGYFNGTIGGFTIRTKLNDVWYSNNGSQWDQATSNAAFSKRKDHSSVVFDNKIWVIGGFDTTNKNDVWYSSDGVNWIEATSNANFSARRYHSTVVFDNKIWLIGGNKGAGALNDVWYSSDGINWIEATSNAAFPEREYHTTLVFDNKIWVIGGANGTNRNDVWHSADGINWIEATSHAAFSERRFHSSAVYDNKMWVIGGLSRNDIWYSEDGVNWIDATPSNSFKRDSHTSLNFNDKLWILAGIDNEEIYYNDIWYVE